MHPDVPLVAKSCAFSTMLLSVYIGACHLVPCGNEGNLVCGYRSCVHPANRIAYTLRWLVSPPSSPSSTMHCYGPDTSSRRASGAVFVLRGSVRYRPNSCHRCASAGTWRDLSVRVRAGRDSFLSLFRTLGVGVDLVAQIKLLLPALEEDPGINSALGEICQVLRVGFEDKIAQVNGACGDVCCLCDCYTNTEPAYPVWLPTLCSYS